MTRSDLVEELAALLPFLMQRDAEQAVKALQDAIVDALVQGQRIEIRGFGSFSIHHRPERTGRNPAQRRIGAGTRQASAHFKPGGKALREAVESSCAHHLECNLLRKGLR